MITYKTGNLLESQADILVNAVNTVGVMGKGIALQFKEKFPKMFEQYKEACKNNELKRGGDLWWWKIQPNKKDLFTKREDKYVLCFATKENWRKSSRIEWIERGLQELCSYFNSDHFHEHRNHRSIAFPKLGCNTGGLEWESQVKPLMEKYLSGLENVDIEIYE